MQEYLLLFRTGVFDNAIFFSHDKHLLKDIERIHSKLIIDLSCVRKKGGGTLITGQDAELLERKITYNYECCEELLEMFYYKINPLQHDN